MEWRWGLHIGGKRQTPFSIRHSPLLRGKSEAKGGSENIMEYSASFLKQRGLVTTGFHLPYNPKLIDRAKMMRKNPTLAEKKLWQAYLRKFKFQVLRQRVIDHFIVDFYIPKLKLVIEVDGEIHNDKDIKEYDKQRSLFLESYNVEVIRFRNEEVINKFDDICKEIEKKINNSLRLEK